jgi:hypothetical protein
MTLDWLSVEAYYLTTEVLPCKRKISKMAITVGDQADFLTVCRGNTDQTLEDYLPPGIQRSCITQYVNARNSLGFTGAVCETSLIRRRALQDNTNEYDAHGLNLDNMFAARAFTEALMTITASIDPTETLINDCLVWQAGIAYDYIELSNAKEHMLLVLELFVWTDLKDSSLSFRAATLLLGRCEPFDNLWIPIEPEEHGFDNDSDSLLVLSMACSRGCVGMVQALLRKQNPAVNASASSILGHDNDNEALWAAVQGGHDEIITMLLSSATFKITKYDGRIIKKALSGIVEGEEKRQRCCALLLNDPHYDYDLPNLLELAAVTIKSSQAVKFLLTQTIFHNKELVRQKVEALLPMLDGEANFMSN